VAALAGGAPVARGPGYYAVLGLGLVATLLVTTIVARTARRALREATEAPEAAEADETDDAAAKRHTETT
jgi:hypothetical protein